MNVAMFRDPVVSKPTPDIFTAQDLDREATLSLSYGWDGLCNLHFVDLDDVIAWASDVRDRAYRLKVKAELEAERVPQDDPFGDSPTVAEMAA